MTLARYACHGLGVVQPIDLVAASLDQMTPEQPAFRVVGGFNPPVHQPGIASMMAQDHAEGKSFVWIGHSMGAAMGFYLPKHHPDWHFKLVITVDPMYWASNINCQDWQNPPPHPGEWKACGRFDRWINIRSSAHPGAGVMLLSAHDKRLEDHHFPMAPHIGIIELPEVRAIIDAAVMAVK